MSTAPAISRQSGESGNKYHRKIYGLKKYHEEVQFVMIDVYSVETAFNVTGPGAQHALKKILCAGLRGKADKLQDLKEARDALDREIEDVEREVVDQVDIGKPRYREKEGTIVYWLDINFEMTPEQIVGTAIELRDTHCQRKQHGPYRIVMHPNWSGRLADFYRPTDSDETLRERLLQIDGIVQVVVDIQTPENRMVLRQVEIVAPNESKQA